MIENFEGKVWTVGELKEELNRLGLQLEVPKDAKDGDEVVSVHDPILSACMKKMFSPWSMVRLLRNMEQKEKLKTE